MKLISWNVNGIRACVQKGFLEFFREADADIFCLQETKLQAGQIELDLEGYEQYWNYAVKKGYSGTAVFTKKKPLNMTYGIGIEEHDQEGRVITLEFEEFYFVTVYTPNSQNELARLDYRMKWESDFLAYLKKLEEKKPVIFCGDLNVAHKEIDLKNPKTNRKNAGFTDEERGKFTEMLDAGFIDTFRYFYPDQEGIYSWWSYRFSARAKNINAGKDSAAVPSTVHCDHLIQAYKGAGPDIATATETNREVYDFLRDVSSRFGIGFWKPGAGIIRQVVLENYAFPGGMMVGTDSHTPNAGGLGMVAIGVGGADAVDVMTGMEWD